MCRKIKSDYEAGCCFQIIAVSNWQLYQASHERKDMEAYADFLAGLAAGDKKCLGKNKKPDMLIIREKQLSEKEYLQLFMRIWEKSRKMGDGQTRMIPHTYLAAAERTGSGWLHLPFPLFQEYQESGALMDLQVGTSVHSVEEAKAAQELGAAYVTAGHIFATDCKKGKAPRGLEFLTAVCTAVTIPVYAIGGIHRGNLPLVYRRQAAGACMMSEYVLP